MGEARVPQIDVGGFDRVDASAAPDDYARWMAHQRAAGADGGIAALQLQAGHRVLDLGCGTGVDLEQMAATARSCSGIDRSFAMAQTAATRSRPGSDGALAVACGDGAALPFATDSFDACWSRAVLLHAPAADRVVEEVARVVRPGGRVVLSEPDHGTHVVNTSELDVFERILRHRRTTFRDPLVGRRLAALATSAGLRVVHVRATPIVHTSLATARAAGGPFDVAVDAAVDAGAITPEEGRRYVASIEAVDAAGGFTFSAMAITVVAEAGDAA